eukprot:TRINITY_DN104680_c0_g1_i1.p1 TRINITY_DN104680_c0_g1~~TRINITY_DN104680_c0_g1_i1.p1  ORF type:complete len:800 (-),score=139.99 TRINITY_DN104680_c0_g1_i1:155-2554(-)
MGKLEDVIYVEAVASSIELLLGQVDGRLEKVHRAEGNGIELGGAIRDLKLQLDRVQMQLRRENVVQGEFDENGKDDRQQASPSKSSLGCDLSSSPDQDGGRGVADQCSLRTSEVSASSQASASTAAPAREQAIDKSVVLAPSAIGKSAAGSYSRYSSSADKGSQRTCFPDSLICPGMGFPLVSDSPRKRSQGWSEHVDHATGATYYYNHQTRESTWTKPGQSVKLIKELEEDADGNTTAQSDNTSTRFPEPAQEAQGADPFHGGIVCNLPGQIEPSTRARTWYMIDPRTNQKMAWDFFVMSAVLFDAMILPFQLAFKNSETDSFDDFWFYWTTTIFCVDLVLSFNTSIELADDGSRPDALIVDRWIVGRKYLRGWFGIDFVSTVPWARLIGLIAGGSGAQIANLFKAVKFLRLMRLMKMLRTAKLRVLWERFEDEMGSVVLVQSLMLVRILMIIIAICHWNACIFWMIGSPDSILTDLMPDGMKHEFQGTLHWTTIWRKSGPDQDAWRWVDRPMTESYVFCFYWTLGVMRTMPAEVTPVNLPERVFVLLFMFFALSAFAIAVASLTQAYFKISERSRAYTDELFAVRMRLKKLQVDKTAKKHIKDFLALQFDRRRIMAKETNLIEKLPRSLKNEVERARKMLYLQKLTILEEFSKATIAEICDVSELFDILPGELLCTSDSVGKAAFVVAAGILQAKNESGQVIQFPQSLEIVDQEILFSEAPVTSALTVMAVTVCELLKVDKEKFLKLAARERGWLDKPWTKRKDSYRGPTLHQHRFEVVATDSCTAASATAAAISAG